MTKTAFRSTLHASIVSVTRHFSFALVDQHMKREQMVITYEGEFRRQLLIALFRIAPGKGFSCEAHRTVRPVETT